VVNGGLRFGNRRTDRTSGRQNRPEPVVLRRDVVGDDCGRRHTSMVRRPFAPEKGL
jgi:hypothetical protein